MERLTIRDAEGTYFITPMGNALSAPELRLATVQVLLDSLATYEDAEEQGLLVRLPKNIRQVVKKKKTESYAMVDELIKSMRPYANDDRLFNAVDAVRVFIAHQNEFLNTLICEEAEAALAKEG